MRPSRFLRTSLVLLAFAVFCGLLLEQERRFSRRVKPSPPPEIKLLGWRSVEEFPAGLAQFETVFWDPRDTVSLRALIRQSPEIVRGRRVLEIGSGTGLLSLCCLKAGAQNVVATDINPAAIANTAYNADHWKLSAGLQTRLVSRDRPDAFAVVGREEKFDVILSNPPWENQRPEAIADYALYDENFRLLETLLAGLQNHLRPGGRAFLAYGCVEAIKTIIERAPRYGLRVSVLDERKLDELEPVFLPGMMLEVTR